MIVIIVGIIIFNLAFQTKNDWKTIGADLIASLLSAITVSLIIGTFTKIISDNILKIEKNDRWLKSFGVDKIGGGRSTHKDTIELFGNPYKNHFPKEVKLLFITGNGFLNHFKNEIITYLKNPTSKLKILLVDVSKSNIDFVERMEAICPQKTSYKDQIEKESLPALREIIAETGAKDRIQLRFFKDEYRYNYRIAKYLDDENVEIKCWWNVQPFNKDAVDLSIMLHGVCNSDTPPDNNVVNYLDKGFDFIFDKYKNTEYKF
jgi:hypothetical protein